MSTSISGCGAESETTHTTSSQVSEVCSQHDDLQSSMQHSVFEQQNELPSYVQTPIDININECIPDDVLMMIFQYFSFKQAVHMLLSIGRSDLLPRLPLRDFTVDTQGPSHELCRVLTNANSKCKSLRNVKWNHLPSPEEMANYQNIEELTFTNSFCGSIYHFVFPERIRRLHFGHSFYFRPKYSDRDLPVYWPPNLTHLSFAKIFGFYHDVYHNIRTIQIPSSVTHLKICMPYDTEIDCIRFPPTIKVLTLTYKNMYSLYPILEANPHLNDYKRVIKPGYIMFIK